MATDVRCSPFWAVPSVLGGVRLPRWQRSIYIDFPMREIQTWSSLKNHKKILLMILSNGFWILFKCTWTNLEQLAMQVLSFTQHLFSNMIARAKRAPSQSRNFCISITIFALIVFILLSRLIAIFAQKYEPVDFLTYLATLARTSIVSVIL